MPCFPSYTRTPYSTLFPYTTLFRSASQVHLYSNAELADIDLQIAHLKLAALCIEIDELTPDHLRGRANSAFWLRSEEHTSELQSHVNLVCRFLLENKNVYIFDVEYN